MESQEILLQGLVIALGINFLFQLPMYINLLRLLKINFKPFSCPFCLSFWISLILVLIGFTINPITVIISPIMTLIIERYITSLPIKF